MHTHPQSDPSHTNTDEPFAGRTAESGAVVARSKEDLLEDFRSLIGEGEALLRSMASLSGDALVQAREVFRGKLARAKARAGELSDVALAGGRQTAVAADDFARDNPWWAIGVAMGLGLVIGALAMKR